MKTTIEINKMISDLISESENYKGKSNHRKGLSRVRKKISELRQIKLYLESNPRREYIEKEIGRLENLIKKTIDMFPDKPSTAPYLYKLLTNKIKSENEYNSNVKKVKTLKFLIN